MLPYILLFAIVFFCACTDTCRTRNKWLVGLALMASMVGMALFRAEDLGGKDSDPLMYRFFYDSMVSYSDYLNGLYVPDFHFVKKPFEPGFFYYTCFIKTLVPIRSIWVFRGVATAFSIILLYKSMKSYTSYVFIAFLFFLYKAYLWHDFTPLLRQIVSISIFVWSVRYIRDGSLFKYLLCCTMAYLFHKASVVLFPLYFFVNYRYSNAAILTFVALSILCMATGAMSGILNCLVNVMGAGKSFAADRGLGINPLNIIEVLLILFFALYQRRYYEQENPYFNIFLNLFLFSSFIMLAFMQLEMMTRVKEFFVCAYMVLVSTMVGSIPQKTTRTVVFFSLAFFCFLGYIRYLYVFDDGVMIPFRWMW